MVKNIGVDKFLISVIIFLLLIGLIMAYNSTMLLAKAQYDDSFYFLKRQLMWMSLGLIIFLFISFLKYPIYLDIKFISLVLFLSLVALVMVFFSGKINNSYRWIRFAGFSIQPSEFAKISIVLYLSYIFGRKDVNVNSLKKLLFLLIPFFIVELLMLKEPDYGNFFLILAITMVILFVAGLKIKYFLYASVLLFPFIYMIVKLSPVRMNRILAFLSPEKYQSTLNFQSIHSLYAIGCGGIFGQGLGNSTQKLYFLPYAYSDFIFSIIAEEAGLIGALLVVSLFFFFFIRGINIAKHSGNKHTYLLVLGLTFLVVSQAMLHISVAIVIFPAKGLPLPFISIGGSSLIATLIISGIIINISKHRKMVLLND